MHEHGAAGLVISPAIGELKALVAGLPVVQVMRRLPDLKASLVSPENREGARKATARLIAAGHKGIAFIGGLTSMILREERLAGYRLALQEAGLPLDSSLIIDTVITYASGGAAAPQLLNLPQPATAALCHNDVVAIGLVRGLTEAGVAVGKDFAVIGFDDIEEAKHTLPALTTVAVNGRNLGFRAARLLMRHLANGDFGRVGDWRAGLGRSSCSLLAHSFVCECHTISTMPRFQPPPRRTQHADFLALRSPVCFASRHMGPILPGRLSALVVQPDSP